MKLLHKIDTFLIEKKKKKMNIKIDSDIMSQKKAIRIPTPPKGGTLFDKPKYSRKEKHKKKYI